MIEHKWETYTPESVEEQNASEMLRSAFQGNGEIALQVEDEFIITCGCGDTDKFSEDAFQMLFPEEDLPRIVHSFGVTKHKLLRQVVNGLTEGKEKYAYLVSYGKAGIVGDREEVYVWDLLKGTRVR